MLSSSVPAGLSYVLDPMQQCDQVLGGTAIVATTQAVSLAVGGSAMEFGDCEEGPQKQPDCQDNGETAQAVMELEDFCKCKTSKARRT